MKRFPVLWLLLIVLLSCREQETSTSRPPSTPRVIAPRSASDTASESESEIFSEETQNFLVPMITLPAEETILVTNDLNLDIDTEDEQIILTQKQTDSTSQIILYVVDYNNDSMAFYKAIETPITLDSPEGISVFLQDLTGNNQNEIVITGFTRDENYSMDAFTILTSGGERGMRLQQILGVSVNGLVDIQSYDRSQAYKMGEITGESFPIITEETDTVDEDNLDLIKTTYKWNNAAKRYMPSSIDKIPGLTIKEEQLEKVYKGSLEEFVSYVSGPWYRVEDLDRNRQPLLQEIIYFDPRTDQIVFSREDVQEIYTWRDTKKIIINRIYIESRNSLISSQRRDIFLDLEDLDRIRIKIHGSAEWEGYYQPVDPLLQASLMTHAGIESSDSLSRLSGQFRNNRGEDLNMELPYFTLKSGTDNIGRGVIEFYVLNEIAVMEMRYLKDNGLMDKREVYSVEYNEADDSSRIIRTLTLTPGSLTARGFVQVPGEPLHYEQIEINDSAGAAEES